MAVRFCDVLRILKKHYGVVEETGGKHVTKLRRDGFRCYTIPTDQTREISKKYFDGLVKCFGIDRAELLKRIGGGF